MTQQNVVWLVDEFLLIGTGVGKVCRFHHSYEEVEGMNILSILSRRTIRRKSRRFPTDTNFYHVFLCTIIFYMMTGVMRGETKRGDDDDDDNNNDFEERRRRRR